MSSYYETDSLNAWLRSTIVEQYEAIEEERETIQNALEDMEKMESYVVALLECAMPQDWSVKSTFCMALLNTIDYDELSSDIRGDLSLRQNE